MLKTLPMWSNVQPQLQPHRRCGVPFLPPNQLSVPNLDPKSSSYHTQTTTQPVFGLAFASSSTCSPSPSPSPNTIEYA
jgi:hypothetical protein